MADHSRISCKVWKWKDGGGNKAEIAFITSARSHVTSEKLHWKKTGRKLNCCLEFLSNRLFSKGSCTLSLYFLPLVYFLRAQYTLCVCFGRLECFWDPPIPLASVFAEWCVFSKAPYTPCVLADCMVYSFWDFSISPTCVFSRLEFVLWGYSIKLFWERENFHLWIFLSLKSQETYQPLYINVCSMHKLQIQVG